jgi:ribosomal-protein-alanine N-acetyltransferase
MRFAIRRMNEPDIDAVLSIERTAFPSPWSRQAFENEIRTDYALPLVLCKPHPPLIIGYLCAWTVLDECHILNLAVHTAYRRQGLASLMLDHLFRLCTAGEVSRFYLEVRETNDQAISLYRKHGFRVCGVRRRYYTDTGEDALLMARRGVPV